MTAPNYEHVRAMAVETLAENLRAWMAEMTTMPADPVKREAAIAAHLAERLYDLFERFMTAERERK